MNSAGRFVEALVDSNYELMSGVPCSYFTEILAQLANDKRIEYLPAVNEGSALSIAAGARLVGRRSAVMIQNSGFGNLINPLSSLVLPYRIPILVIMSMRGWPDADPGEPQHELMGRLTHDWLSSMDIPFVELVEDGGSPEDVISEASKCNAGGQTAFVLVGKGAISAQRPTQRLLKGITRDDLVAVLANRLTDELVVSTTGYLSRSLFERADRSQNFYMQGSMGHAPSIVLGAAVGRPDRRFIVLDGDGAFVMHMGVAASIGTVAPSNLVHIIFDNAAYESTGGQSGPVSVDLAQVAASCGYRASSVDALAELDAAVVAVLNQHGPVLLHVKGVVGGSANGRASESLSLSQIAARFNDSLLPNN